MRSLCLLLLTTAGAIPVFSTQPVLVTTTSIPDATRGVGYNTQLMATGGSGSYTWSLYSGSLPQNLSIASAGSISGAVLATGATGPYNFTVRVSDALDSENTSLGRLTLNVVNPPPITVQPDSLPSGQVGFFYSQSFKASGGNGGPFTFSITPAVPPFGLSFSGSTLSGTPTSSGTATVTITATDGTSQGHTDYSLTIIGPLNLSPTAIPNGTVAVPYSATFTATGGLGTYTFSLIGTQPPGLNFTPSGATATLAGTPRSAGLYHFTVQVSDGSRTVSVNLDVTISNPPITLTPAALVPGIVNGQYFQTFVAGGGNGGPYTYTMNGSVPGLTFSPTAGVLSGVPSTAGPYTFTIGVSDGSQFTPPFPPQTYSLTVYGPITISPTAIPSADLMVMYSQTFSATGGVGSGYTYSINTPPPGLNFSTNGVLSGQPTTSGAFSFTITARDGTGFTGTSPAITLTVNQPLTLSPSTLPSGQVSIAYSQTLTASGGSGGYTYSLGGNPPPGLGMTGAVLGGAPTAAGTFTFSITARDSVGGFVTNSYTVPITNPIVVQPGTIPSGQVGVAYPSQTFTASGGNGGPYTFSITPATPPFGLTFSGATLSGTPTSSGTAPITITASDGTSQGHTDYSLTIAPGPLTLSPSSIPNGTVGTPYSQTFTATGGSGTYTFSLVGTQPPGLKFTPGATTATLAGTPTTGGQYGFTVQVNDGSKTVSQTLNVSITNLPITLSPSTLAPAIVNAQYSQTFTASGGNGGPYTYSITGSTPGLVLNTSTGVLSGTPNSATTYNFTIGVTDQSPFTPAFTPKSYSITVYGPITISPLTLPNADPNVNYSQTFAASGGSGSGYTYSISAAPPGLNLNTSTGVLSGQPSSSGPFSFTITAKDGSGFVGTSPAITLTVNPALTLSPATLPSAQINVGYSQAFTASGGSGGYTYSLGGAMPPGLGFTGAVLSGTPAANGTFPFSITARDSLGGSVTNSYSLVVANSAIVVQPAAIPSGQVNAPYSQTFTATGGAGSGYTFSIAAPAPFGLNFNAQTATLAGTPTSSGTASITISATDGTLTGQRTYTLTVAPAGLTLSPSTIANGIMGVKYSQMFTASGGSGNYTFALSPSNPPGLNFSYSGAAATLSGTPTMAGSFPISVQVSDGTASVSRSYTIGISGSALSISTTTVPDGTQNTSYSAGVSASGGLPPYNWALVQGSQLPPGLQLSSTGAITGTPTLSGKYSFAVIVTDASGSTATASFTMSVGVPQLTFTTSSPLPPALSGKAYSVTFGATGGAGSYSFSLTPPAPPGLGLTSNGVLSGTIYNPTPNPITYNVSVTVTDGANNRAGMTFQLTVQPAAAGIILSEGSLAIPAVSGGMSPPSNYVSVSSTTEANIKFDVSSDSPWLSATPGGGITPATLQININQSFLLSSPDPKTYTGIITVTGPDGPHTVMVTMNLAGLPPQLSVAPTILSFTTDGTSQPGAGSIQVSNAGTGTITYSASLVNGSSWVSLGSAPIMVTSTTPASIPVNVSFSGLADGDYRDVVHIDSSAGTADVPVTLLVAGGSTVTLVPAGSLFSARKGQSLSSGTRSFQIVTTGTSGVGWTASLIGGSGWLTLNTTTGASRSDRPSVVSYTVDTSNLDEGDYYARIHVDAPSATNSPIDFEVVANVRPITSPAVPDPSPAGLLFISSPGSPVPPAQSVTINTSSATPLSFSAAANTYSGGNWLMVTGATGKASSSAAGQAQVTVNPAGLSPGVYQGGVSFTMEGNTTGVRTVNVLLIVTGSSQPPKPLRPALHSDVTGCTPSKLVALQSGLVSNFSTPAGWPTPLAIQLADDCGNTVGTGSVVATFSNGDAPLALPLTDSRNAVYSATWNPHGVSNQVTVTAKATAPSLQAATAQIVGAISPNKVPILYRHGTIHNLNPLPGGALAPGTIVQIYGSGLAPNVLQTALPLPTNVSGTTVIIGGVEAPLYYVSDGQINAQLPLELSAGRQYQILVSANGALTTPDTLDIQPVTPGVASLQDGTIIAQHADSSYVTAASPAHPGEILTIYLAGMGLTDVAVKTGQPGPSSPLANTMVQPTVSVNGETAQISFAGLTPQAVGLYQINFTVPQDAPPGNLKLLVAQGNAKSNVSTLFVQP